MNALPKLLKIALLPLLAVSLNAASSYKVQPGDTLSSIARKNGTSASSLMKTNGISNPNKLRVGQVLKISSSSNAPAKKTTSTRSSASTSGNYTVKPGETLYSIARRHSLSVSQLTNMNPGLDPSKLSVGQKITVKGSSKPKAKAKSTPKPKPQPIIAQTPKPASQPAPQPQRHITPTPVLITSQLPPIAPDLNLNSEPKLTARKKMPAPAKISSVLVNKEISLGALASKHRTSTRQLNELNGWNLKPTTILAKDSEVYVPGA